MNIRETAEQREAEKKVAQQWGVAAGYIPEKLTMNFPADFAMCQGAEVKQWIEIKSRTNSYNEYDTVLVNADKFTRLTALEEATSILAYLIFVYPEGIYYIASNDLQMQMMCRDEEMPLPTVQMIRRMDRGDALDLQPVIVIPKILLSKFTITNQEKI